MRLTWYILSHPILGPTKHQLLCYQQAIPLILCSEDSQEPTSGASFRLPDPQSVECVYYISARASGSSWCSFLLRAGLLALLGLLVSLLPHENREKVSHPREHSTTILFRDIKQKEGLLDM